ncbi:MAG: hypothetical protein KDD78_13430, partial [Caldilineaceae bacterium]|nr:hypothetical protein [Caldilineaceae bacterium]
MFKKRSWLLLLAVAVVALVFAACAAPAAAPQAPAEDAAADAAPTEEAMEEAPAAAGDAVELRIAWYDDGNEGSVLRELLDRFEAD